MKDHRSQPVIGQPISRAQRNALRRELRLEWWRIAARRAEAVFTPGMVVTGGMLLLWMLFGVAWTAVRHLIGGL